MSKPDYLAHLHDTATYFAAQIMAGNSSGKSETHFANYLNPKKTQIKPMGFSWLNPDRSQAERNDNGSHNRINELPVSRMSRNGTGNSVIHSANLFAKSQQKEWFQHE